MIDFVIDQLLSHRGNIYIFHAPLINFQILSFFIIMSFLILTLLLLTSIHHIS